MLDPMMEQLLPGFVDESKEIVDRVTEHLIELEKARDEPRFDDLARGLHTLKGSAATLGLADLSELAHRMEDAVLPLRKKPVALPGAQTAGSRALRMGVQQALASDGEEAGDIVSSMEEQLKTICTLPLRTVLEPLRRSVRDLCKQSGKLARLSVVGGEMSLDRRVLESLRAPLVALVRNAVDHGLEMPEVREAGGKHREGSIVVRVEQQGNRLFVEVSDDGSGLDLAAI